MLHRWHRPVTHKPVGFPVSARGVTCFSFLSEFAPRPCLPSIVLAFSPESAQVAKRRCPACAPTPENQLDRRKTNWITGKPTWSGPAALPQWHYMDRSRCLRPWLFSHMPCLPLNHSRFCGTTFPISGTTRVPTQIHQTRSQNNVPNSKKQETCVRFWPVPRATKTCWELRFACTF